MIFTMKILFTFMMIIAVIMPPSLANSHSYDNEDDEDLSSDQNNLAGPLKKVDCHHFNESSEDCGLNGLGCNKTVTCEARASEPDPACFILWENRKISKTDTSTGEITEEFAGPVIKLKGCWSGHSALYCSETSKCVEKRKKAKKDLFFCCCRGHLCNDDFTHDPTENSDNSVTSMELSRDDDATQWILVSVVSAIILLGILYTAWWFRFHKNNLFNPLSTAEDLLPMNDPFSPTISFGPIHSMEVKAKGRYGSVYRAKVGDSVPEKLVAVKIFQDKNSWKKEVEVYQLPQMKHENILVYLGAEKKFLSEGTEYWLVTEYHDLGSLYDYLKAHVVSYQELLKISLGIARGLDYLHDEIPATCKEGLKPTVAHRDFKSKNVLLKPDLTACIADFGLALVFKPNEPSQDLGQFGTPVYMAPELLEGAISFSKEGLLRIDMYACGLTLWELVSRCSAQDGPVSDYRLPFEEEIGVHPALEEVQQLVSQKKQRPAIQETWRRHKGLSKMCDTIEELLDQEAEARLTAANVEGRISGLINGDNVHSEFFDDPHILVNHSTPPSTMLIPIQSQQQATSISVDVDT